VEVSHLTLVNQQVVALGESISLGIADADRVRALVVVDAPAGTSVTALKSQDPLPRRRSPRQNLLQFMGQPPEKASEDRDAIDTAPRPADCPPTGGGPDPKLLPFPPPAPRRQRM